jgi:hypothetical protein
MICPVGLASDVSALQAVRVGDDAQHAFPRIISRPMLPSHFLLEPIHPFNRVRSQETPRHAPSICVMTASITRRKCGIGAPANINAQLPIHIFGRTTDAMSAALLAGERVHQDLDDACIGGVVLHPLGAVQTSRMKGEVPYADCFPNSRQRSSPSTKQRSRSKKSQITH